MSWYYERFPTSRPREAKGGIKAQTKRGAFGKSWWAKRWIAVLESFNIGARLGRGRTYARKGQVLSVNIDKGLVTGSVQGSRSKPYAITIRVSSLAGAEWKKVARQISHQAIFAAKLLAGEMPQDIEAAFEEAGISLFPKKSGDLETHCSCPDWSNPCKHIAAVYYLLGEEFDRDPFLIFKLRGMTREEFIELLDMDIAQTGQTSLTGQTGQLGAGGERAVSALAPVEPLKPEPLSVDISGFWDGTALPDDLFGEVQTPAIPAALPKRLGNFPFWRGEGKFMDSIEPVYTGASPRGMGLFLGELKTKG